MGNPKLVEILEEAKLMVEEVATYDTIYETQDLIDLAEEFENGTIDCAVFTSSSSVHGFSKAVKDLHRKTDTGKGGRIGYENLCRREGVHRQRCGIGSPYGRRRKGRLKWI